MLFFHSNILQISFLSLITKKAAITAAPFAFLLLFSTPRVLRQYLKLLLRISQE